MKTGIATALVAAIGALGAIVYTSLFVVDQRQQALVVEFGNPQRIVQAPGLQWKKPWQNVMFFDKRLLDFDADDLCGEAATAQQRAQWLLAHRHAWGRTAK